MITRFIRNSLQKKTGYYAAILGSSPSKGARSPLLWNAVFQEKTIPAQYLAFDIDSDNNLKKAIDYLKNDPYFIGGSVTIPYKEIVMPFLDDLHESAECGAINCLYRNQPGKLSGMNTDGLGAVQSLKQSVDFQNLLVNQKNLNVLIWGAGGVARAIATALLIEKEFLIKSVTVGFFSTGRVESWKSIASKLSYSNRLSLKMMTGIKSESKKFDLIIQCTPVGSALSELEDLSPFGDERTLEVLSTKDAVFFDVNYAPLQSLAMSHWKKIRSSKPLNGLDMNRLQAVIAFDQVLEGVSWLGTQKMSLLEIETIMKQC